MSRMFIGLVALTWLVSAPPSASAQADVAIKTADAVLDGTYYSPNAAGPAIILFHQCNSNRRAWNQLASDLAASGFHVLTFNYRGVENRPDAPSLPTPASPPAPPPPPPPSGGDPPKPPQSMTRDGADSAAALTYLLSQKGVDTNRVAAGGAGCGVSEAITLTRRHPEPRALVLLSGWPRKENLQHLATTPTIAVFGVAARQDATAPFDINAAVTASKHPQSTQKIYGGWDHGAALFARDPDLAPTVIRWLLDVLVR